MSSTSSNNSLSPLRRQREHTQPPQHSHHVMTQPVFLQKILPYAANNLNSVATFKSVTSSWLETQVHYSGTILCWKAFIESEPRETNNSDNTATTNNAQDESKPIKQKTHDFQTVAALGRLYLNAYTSYSYSKQDGINERQRARYDSSLKNYLAVTEIIIQSLTILEPSKQMRLWKIILFRTNFDTNTVIRVKVPAILLNTARFGQLSSFDLLFDIASNFDVERSSDHDSSDSDDDEPADKARWLKRILARDDDAIAQTLNKNSLLLNACKADDGFQIVRFVLDKIDQIDNNTKNFLRKQLRITESESGMNALQTACFFATFNTVKLIVDAILSLDDVEFLQTMLETQVPDESELDPDTSRYASYCCAIQQPTGGFNALNVACARSPYSSSKDTVKIIQLLIDTTLTHIDDDISNAEVKSDTCLGTQMYNCETKHNHGPLETAFFVGQHAEVVSVIISALRILNGLTDYMDGFHPRKEVRYTSKFIDHENEELSALVVAALFSPVCTLKLVFDEIEKEEGTSGLLNRINEQRFTEGVSPFKCAKTKEKFQLFVDTFLRIGGEKLLRQQLHLRSGSDGETVLMTICRLSDDAEDFERLLTVITKLSGERYLRKQLELKTSRDGKSFLRSIAADRNSKNRKSADEKIMKLLESKQESLLVNPNIRKYLNEHYPPFDGWYEERQAATKEQEERTKQRNLRRQREAAGSRSHSAMQDAVFLKKILPFASDLHYSAAIFKGVCTSWQHVLTRCGGAALCWKAFMEDEIFPVNVERAGEIVRNFLPNLYDSSKNDYSSSFAAFRGMVVKEIFDACCVDSSSSSSSLARKLLLDFRDRSNIYYYDSSDDMLTKASNKTLLMEVCERGDAFAFKLLMGCADKAGGDALVLEMFNQFKNERTCETPLSMASGLTLFEKIFERFDKIDNPKDKKKFIGRQLNQRTYRNRNDRKGWTPLMTSFGDLVQNSFQEILLKLELGEEPGSNSFVKDILSCGKIRLCLLKFIEIRQFEKCCREINHFAEDHAPLILEACGFGKEFVKKLKEDGYSDEVQEEGEDDDENDDDDDE